MDNLLANYLSVGDSINVHLLGDSELVKLFKTQEHLGLTITDNGHGRAFVKRMKCNNKELANCIKPGDHIARINGQSVVGLRHFEVAKALRQIPLNAEFELEIIKPLIKNSQATHLDEDSFNDKQKPITSTNNDYNGYHQTHHNIDSHIQHQQAQSLMLNPTSYQKNKRASPSTHDYMSLEDLADSSLPLERILSRTSAINSSIKTRKNHIPEVVSNTTDQDVYKTIIKKISTILESFIGIDDHTLAIRIYRSARDHNKSLEDFSNAIQSSDLSVFNFGSEIESHLWNCVNKAL